MKHLLAFFFFTVLTMSAYAQQSCIDCELIDPYAICTSIWNPVCGCDGVTYSNDCVAINSAGVTYWEQGECPSNNVSICSDLSGVDFGSCDMVLGIAVVDGECVTVSGCSTIAMNGVNYSSVFTGSLEFCEQNCLCVGANGLDDIQSLEFAVIPNPIHEGFQIRFQSSQALNLSITDITGREVLNLSITSGQWIDVNHLIHGTYILSLEFERKEIRTMQVYKVQEK